MVKEFSAIFEHGVLRPLEPLPLADAQVVKVTIAVDETADSILALARAEAAKWTGLPSHAELRRMLADVPGAFSDDLDRDRGE